MDLNSRTQVRLGSLNLGVTIGQITIATEYGSLVIEDAYSDPIKVDGWRVTGSLVYAEPIIDALQKG
jgi:hypothetical protein